MTTKSRCIVPIRWPIGWAIACALAGLGCPAEVEHAPRRAGVAPPPPPPPVTDEADPRVVKEGEDLYAAQAVARRDEAPTEARVGAGKPDESNGVCRLFAPKLENPDCCAAELGFDAEVVSEACGLDVYLGESFQASCGYFFHEANETEPFWFRMSVVEDATPQAAIDAHVERLQVRHEAKGVEAKKVPGVPGAFYTVHDGLAWAFIPGWKKVRQLAWRDRFCSIDGVARVIAGIASAKEPMPGEPRLGLVPKARS